MGASWGRFLTCMCVRMRSGHEKYSPNFEIVGKPYLDNLGFWETAHFMCTVLSLGQIRRATNHEKKAGYYVSRS